MLMCDYCADFFHLECVNISKEAALSIKHYQCPSCTENSELLYDEGKIHYTVKSIVLWQHKGYVVQL